MKFFNKQRFNLMKGERLQKYLLYAIGEIVLVVIGILVAVAINNYNETKKTEKEMAKIANQVQQKLESDLDKVKQLRIVISEELKLYNLYLKKNKTDGEKLKVITQAPFLVTINIEFLSINPVISAALEKATINNTEVANKLLEIEQDYKTADKSLQPMEDIIKNEMVSNINHIKDNFEWYEKLVGDDKNFTLDEYKYFGSADYRNRVAHMKFLYADGYDSLLEELEMLLERHVKELTRLL